MFERAIWDKFPECNFKILKNHKDDLSQNRPNQTCDYWLVTPNQQTFCIETNIF